MKQEKFDVERVKKFVDYYEKFKNAYFWTPPSPAAARRRYEKQNSISYKFKKNKNLYECELHVTCSCANIYVNRNIRVNGEKKNIRALKALIS